MYTNYSHPHNLKCNFKISLLNANLSKIFPQINYLASSFLSKLKFILPSDVQSVTLSLSLHVHTKLFIFLSLQVVRTGKGSLWFKLLVPHHLDAQGSLEAR